MFTTFKTIHGFHISALVEKKVLSTARVPRYKLVKVDFIGVRQYSVGILKKAGEIYSLPVCRYKNFVIDNKLICTAFIKLIKKV